MRRQDASRARKTPTPAPVPGPASGRRDQAIVFAAAAVLTGLVAGLHILGYRLAPAGRVWPGFIGSYANDSWGYLAWIRQARDGALLFREQFTTEPHGRVFFHPLFLAAGLIPRATGLPLMAGWWILQGLLTLALPVALDRFLREVVEDGAVRWTAFTLCLTGSGLGWAWGAADATPWTRRPIDTWMPESGIFHAATTSFFTLTAALAVLLMLATATLRLARTGRRRVAVSLGLWGAALLAIHPYDIVEAGGVIAAFVLLFARARWKEFLLAGAIATPYALYCAAVALFDPVFSAHREVTMERPTLAATLAGFGLPLGAAVAGLLWPAARETLGRDRADIGWRFAAVWLVEGFALTQLPLGFERKLLLGLSIPIALFAAAAVVQAGRVVVGRTAGAAAVGAVAAVFVAACAVGSLQHYRLNVARAAAGAEDTVPIELIAACHWLESASAPEAAVIAGPEIAPMIPGLTGRTVFAGHWAQTVDVPGKIEFLRTVFGPAEGASLVEMDRILRRNGIRWAVLDAGTRARFGESTPDEALAVSRLGSVRFRNRFVTIWELSGAPVPWGSGDWRGRAALRSS